MAITVSNIKSNLDTYLGDSTTDRISDAERFQAMTEATVWLLEELGNEHMLNTYVLDYLDTVNYYRVTTDLADLLVGGDLRREEGKNYQSFSRKSPREISEEIAIESRQDPSWAVERRDGEAYLVVNAQPLNTAKQLVDFDSVTGWTVDGDAINITLDSNEFKQGTGCLNFDVDVSVSGTNTAIVENIAMDSTDLSSYEDLGSWIFEVYIPENQYTTSWTLDWGSSISDYWSATATTDIGGNALSDGWNTIKIDWNNASIVGTPDSGDITFIAFTLTYGASQPDDTDYRIDNLRIANPEKLTFHYVSWNVGKSSAGADLTAYTATTDIPFYSGAYDQYRYAVAHKAASILYYSALRLVEQGSVEESEALKSLRRYQKNFESSKTREIKSFKIFGNNLRQGNRRR